MTDDELREAVAEPAWLQPQLDKIAALGPNWDGYGADPIDPAMMAEMRRALRFEVPPTLVPGADGSIQAEWYLTDADVWLCVTPRRWKPNGGDTELNDAIAAAETRGMMRAAEIAEQCRGRLIDADDESYYPASAQDAATAIRAAISGEPGADG